MSGMRTALGEFRNNLINCPYDVVCLSETWLQPGYLDSEVIPGDWQVFRQDRGRVDDQDRLGGGVLIAVKSEHHCKTLVTNVTDKIFDLVAIELLSKGKKFIVICFYIPPRASLDEYTDLGVKIEEIVACYESDHAILIMGDANLDKVLWIPNDDIHEVFDPVNINTKYEFFLSKLQSLGLYQLNNRRNVSGNVLDNIFSNILSDLRIDESSMNLTRKTSIYHKILHLQYKTTTAVIDDRAKFQRKFKYDFNKANYNEINARLNEMAINFDKEVDEIVLEFHEKLISILDDCVPKKEIIRLSCARHLDRPLRMLRNKRNRAFKRKDLSVVEHRRFLALRDKFETDEALAIEEYNRKITLKVVDDPKYFWSVIKETKNGKGYPSVMKFKDNRSNKRVDIAKFFSDNLKSVFNDPISFLDSNFSHIVTSEEVVSEIVLTKKSVEEIIDSLGKNKGPGHDLIPASFLKHTKSTISDILLSIFNKSLEKGVFPQFWKKALITPIFKSGFKDDVENYRGISILSVFSKIFEKAVCNFIKPQISHLIDVSQHGFENGRSTVTNLAEYTSFLRSSLSKKQQIDSIYTDFSKAFDKVDHKLLIFKLRKYGFCGPILNWLESYLSNRVQVVKFEDVVSEEVLVTSGVPQGSVLGPILFVLFINDLPKLIEDCDCSLFADDLKLYKKVTSTEDSTVLQENIDKITKWCRDNGMALNASKCSIISFYRGSLKIDSQYKIGDDTLGRATVIRDLGVMLDEKLNFKSHVDKIVSSARSVFGFVKRRAKTYNDPHITKTLYCGLVQPIIEYASVIWAPYTKCKIDKIESVQKQFLIFALKPLGFSGYVLPRYESRLLLLNMTTLDNRRRLAYALFGFDLVRKRLRVNALNDRVNFRVNTFNLRQHRILREELHSSNFSSNDCVDLAIRIFNDFGSLYDNNVTREGFKVRILREMKKLLNNRNS